MYTYDQIIHVLIAQWHSLSRDSAWIYSYIFIFLPLHHDTLNGDLALPNCQRRVSTCLRTPL